MISIVAAVEAADWPQWRGPDSSGTPAPDGPLPETWGEDSPNVRWRTELPGEGISSPIVTGDRVFLTTAYEGSGSKRLMLLLRGLTIALASGSVLALARRRFFRRGAPGPEGTSAPTAADRWDARFTTAALFVFLLGALVLAVRPELFLEVSNPGRAWRLTGGIALLGLAAAAGMVAASAPLRAVLALTIVAGVTLLVVRMPTGPLGPAPFEKWLPFVVLPTALAVWHLARFLISRRRAADRVAGLSRLPLAATLVALAVLVFVPLNFLHALQRVVVCIDLKSGEILWERPVLSGVAEQKWPNSSYATPTAATDGDLVFAYFGHGLAALDLEGEVRWVQRFPGYAHATRYGASTSPLLTQDSVVIAQEEEMHQGGPPSWIAAFDKTTGSIRWRVEPPEARDSYGTPLLVPTSHGDRVLVASWEALTAYDAATGTPDWSRPHPLQQLVASLVRSGDLLALSGGVYGPRSLWVLRLFPEEPTRPAEVLWETNQTVATVSSPVFYNGMLFTLTTPGVMSCYDAETGELFWRQRLDGEFYPSAVAGDGRVYATNTDGATSVVAAKPTFEVLAVNELNETVYASPAISDGCLLLRTAEHLYCIER